MEVSDAFMKFPKEAAIIGRILAGYTDLELDLMHCVALLSENFDLILKKMFKVRGESRRINIAAQIGCKKYAEVGLEQQFGEAVEAVRHCVKIRNQYAHCVFWDDNSGSLAFANLEELAMRTEVITDLRGVCTHHASSVHLQNQLDYFSFASDMLVWTIQEANKRIGRPALLHLNRPVPPKRPDLWLP